MNVVSKGEDMMAVVAKPFARRVAPRNCGSWGFEGGLSKEGEERKDGDYKASTVAEPRKGRPEGKKRSKRCHERSG